MNRLREALAEREQSTADATRKGDDMCRLLADVAHEIRTPLTALKSYSNLHAKEMLAAPGALDRAMSRVGDESIRLNVLVNSMLHSLSAMARTRRSLMSRLWITVLGWPKTNARRFSRLSTAQIRREFETAMMEPALVSRSHTRSSCITLTQFSPHAEGSHQSVGCYQRHDRVQLEVRRRGSASSCTWSKGTRGFPRTHPHGRGPTSLLRRREPQRWR